MNSRMLIIFVLVVIIIILIILIINKFKKSCSPVNAIANNFIEITTKPPTSAPRPSIKPVQEITKIIIPSDTPENKNKIDNATIFINISSYRDINCKNTVYSLLSAAFNTKRLFFGIYEQNNNSNDKEKCISTDNIPTDIDIINNPNIKVLNVSYERATGPISARNICNKLYNNEDFYLMIDAHTQAIVKNWDSCLISDYLGLSEQLNTTKLILSSFPFSDDSGEDPNLSYSETASLNLEKNSGFYIGGASLKSRKDYKPIDSPSLSGGNTFTIGEFVKESYFDDLQGMFNGEEELLSAGAYEKGWKIVPNPTMTFSHFYTRPDDPKIWVDNKNFNEAAKYSQEKVRKILNPNYEIKDKDVLECLANPEHKHNSICKPNPRLVVSDKTRDFYKTNFQVDL